MEIEAAAQVARSSVRASTVWLARGVDSWFGDRPFEQGGQVSDGRLSMGLLKRQRESTDVDVRFSARYRLPNLEERTYLFLGRDDPRGLVADQPGEMLWRERLFETADAAREYFAGIGGFLSDRLDYRVGLRGGLNPYGQVRLTQRWAMGPQGRAEFRQTAFWSVEDSIGATTTFDYQRSLSALWAARWLSSATITREKGHFEVSSLLGAYRSFGEQRLWALEGLVKAEQGRGVGVTDLGLQTRWEQPVHGDWLLGSVVLGHFWPRKNAQVERRGAWALGASLTMRF